MQETIEKSPILEKQALETITPSQAKAYLATCRTPRIQNAKIQRLANMINRGEWRLSHQGIALDLEGRLVDGQQRLHAIIRANKPIEILVTRNLRPEARRVIDRGSPRSQGDMLHYAFGKADGRRITPHARLLARMVLGIDTAGNLPLLNRVHEYFSAGINWAVQPAIKSTPFCPNEIITALAYAYPTAPEMAEEFYRAFVENRNLQESETCPVAVLRNSMVNQVLKRQRKSREDNFLKALTAIAALFDGKPMAVSRVDRKAIERFRSAYPDFASFKQ